MLKQQYSLSEWVELFAFLRIAGPVGPARKDYDVTQLSIHAGGPYPKKPRWEDFQPPWTKPPPIHD